MKKQQIDSVLIALRRLMRATDLYSRDLARKTGLTTPQLLLMQSIRQRGEVSIRELSEQVNLSQATVTSILDRLEARGLVVRRRSTEDKRKVHAYLTDDGKAIIRKSPPPLQNSFINQFKKLDEWEQNMILSSLQRVAAMMDANKEPATPILHAGPIPS